MDKSLGGIARYEDPAIAAAYIEFEWCDVLRSCGLLPNSVAGLFSPQESPMYYHQVLQFALNSLERFGYVPQIICDIGCSTGRLLYECHKRLPATRAFLGVEPSSVTSEFAKRILRTGGPQCWAPFPRNNSGTDYVHLDERFFSCIDIATDARGKFDVFVGPAEKVPRPEHYFDLMFCLNVADRHPNPRLLVCSLRKLLADGGVLIFSSPMDWSTQFTAANEWVDDLKELFPESGWRIVAETDIEYPMRYTQRKKTQFMSQTLCMRAT